MFCIAALLFPLTVILSSSPSIVTDLSITNSVPLRVIVPPAIESAKVIVPPFATIRKASRRDKSSAEKSPSSSSTKLSTTTWSINSTAPISACPLITRSTPLWSVVKPFALPASIAGESTASAIVGVSPPLSFKPAGSKILSKSVASGFADPFDSVVVAIMLLLES